MNSYVFGLTQGTINNHINHHINPPVKFLKEKFDFGFEFLKPYLPNLHFGFESPQFMRRLLLGGWELTPRFWGQCRDDVVHRTVIYLEKKFDIVFLKPN